MKNFYLNRYAWPGPILSESPDPNTNIIVVIPCYHEPDILLSLDSLYNCYPPGCHTEVIVVVNHSENETAAIKEFNQKSADDITAWAEWRTKSHLSFHVIKAFDLPQKQAGVGLARKIGMDEAVRRFESIGNKNGIIVWFDADSICTPNYLHEINEFYRSHLGANSALLHFEHPLEGMEEDEVYEAIINYEIHLRYYKNALKYANFPYGFHTIGSCITVSSGAYQKQGGMNTRKAGEDFYFLQKLFPLGGMHTINTATVFPSPRPSDRVPFGTGKAIKSMLEKGDTTWKTYNPKTFMDFKYFVDKVPGLYDDSLYEEVILSMPQRIQLFLKEIGFEKSLIKIKNNCASEARFFNSFYNWFNGFNALKFVHFARDNFYPDIDVLEAANWILGELTNEQTKIKSRRKALELLRELDKSD